MGRPPPEANALQRTVDRRGRWLGRGHLPRWRNPADDRCRRCWDSARSRGRIRSRRVPSGIFGRLRGGVIFKYRHGLRVGDGARSILAGFLSQGALAGIRSLVRGIFRRIHKLCLRLECRRRVVVFHGQKLPVKIDRPRWEGGRPYMLRLEAFHEPSLVQGDARTCDNSNSKHQGTGDAQGLAAPPRCHPFPVPGDRGTIFFHAAGSLGRSPTALHGVWTAQLRRGGTGHGRVCQGKKYSDWVSGFRLDQVWSACSFFP